MDWGTLAEEKQMVYLLTDKLNVYKVDSDISNLEVHEPDVEYGRHYKELNVATKEMEEKELPKEEKEAVVYDYIGPNPQSPIPNPQSPIPKFPYSCQNYDYNLNKY